MFGHKIKPCAAGDLCYTKPVLADPQHKCPKCCQHIHAICGVPDDISKNEMNNRLCFECFCKFGKSSDINISTASENDSTTHLHKTPTPTGTPTRSNLSGLSTDTTRKSPLSLPTANLTSDASSESDTESDDGGTESVRALYNSVSDRSDRIRLLLTLSLGSTRDLATETRLKQHVKAGRIERGRISLRGKVEYNAEIVRRAKYLVTGTAKQP